MNSSSPDPVYGLKRDRKLLPSSLTIPVLNCIK
jgi:hypothetical protein